jgi:hypothetical protein
MAFGGLQVQKRAEVAMNAYERRLGTCGGSFPEDFSAIERGSVRGSVVYGLHGQDGCGGCRIAYTSDCVDVAFFHWLWLVLVFSLW